MHPLPLEVRDLTVRYGERTVVDGIDLDAPAGQVTAVLGPNGAGKTTTIECAEGLRTPTSGSLRVLGHAAGSAAARAHTGVMLQDGGLPLGRSVRDVLDLARALHRGRSTSAQLLEQLGLQDVARTPVRRLSGGQRQRVALAVAACSDPALLFLDEPSAGLDPHARRDVWELVRERRAGGAAVVLTTHLLQEAEELADVVHIMVAGRIIASGSPRELVARHAGSDTLRFTLERPLSASEEADLARAVAPCVLAHDGEAYLLREVPAPGPLTSAVATWCERRGVTLRSLQVGGGTLEHVYLTLTSRERQLELATLSGQSGATAPELDGTRAADGAQAGATPAGATPASGTPAGGAA